MALDEEGTILEILGPDPYYSSQGLLTLYSARGLQQTLTPIGAQPQVERTINGEAFDASDTQFRKYDIKITCTDQRIPALDNIWAGMEVVIKCICELAYPVYGSPSRTVVGGSQRTEGGFVFYRPQLTCVITNISMSKDEWPADVAWEIDATEK